MHPLVATMTIAASVIVLQGPGRVIAGESANVYELSAVTAAGIAPPRLRAFLEANLDSVQHAALSVATSSAADDSASSDMARHCVRLDVAAAGDDDQARHAAALRFPRDRAEAKELYSKHGASAGGWLPWVIQEQYGKLARAFKSGDAEQVAREAGVLLHFATDAALPFNTTARSLSATSGLPAASGKGSVSTGATANRLRQRFHGALVRRLRDRFDYEVRVSPDRLTSVPDVLDAVFAVSIDARRAADRLVDLDRSIVASLGAGDVDAFVASSDLYFGKLTEAAAPILETQIEAGALLSANLITAAWVEAGRPLPGAATESRPTEDITAQRSAEDAKETQTVGSHLVGSRNSTTYHRASCSHAARIKAENLVHFADVDEASKAGRRPCKACRPEAP